MKDFLELLVKNYGLPEFLASNLMLCFYVLLGFYTVFKAIKAFQNKRIQQFIKKEIDQDLHPFFTHQEIVNYTKFYVPQYFQNIVPTDGEELNSKHAAAARSKLMPEFLKKGLLTRSPIKYFIILSDTGMGKTAFLINLYRKYKALKPNRDRIVYQIRLFPLGSKYALEQIKNLEDKKNTILLLDAFDEDIKAVIDYRERMMEILEAVRDFRKIIFTCRTQFFPSKEEEPTDTDDITFGENIKHSIHKLYLSAFDEKDILSYLFRKYEFSFYRLYRAYNLVRKCPSLMFRPMLLTYIDDLLKGKLFYKYSFEMYHVMIDKWVDREALKPAVRSRHSGRYSFEEKLWSFSYDLAVNLYDEREKRQGYTISVENLKKLVANKSIGNDVLSLGDSTGRSLLNRNSLGQFKFAHKSILEYLLAYKLFYDPKLLNRFDFHGMDATQNFHQEMLANMLKRIDGKYYLNNDAKPKPLAAILPGQIKNLEQLIIHRSSEASAENFAGLNHVKRITYASIDLLPIYIIYLYVDLFKKSPERFSNNNIIDAYSEVPKDILQSLENLGTDYIRQLLDNCEFEKNLKTLLNEILANGLNGKLEIGDLDALKKTVIKGGSERAVVLEAYDEFKKFKKIKSYLTNVELFY